MAVDMMEGLALLSLIPITGLTIYLGLISGYIPSPLYNRNEKWPKEYAILQLIFIILTASRLSFGTEMNAYEEDDDEYEKNVREFTMFSNWLGASLYNWIYLWFKKDPIYTIKEIGHEFVWFLFAAVLANLVRRNKTLSKWDNSNLPMTLIFVRNLLIFFAINAYFIKNSLFHPESEQGKYCRKEYNVTPGLVAPNYPMEQVVDDFFNAWKRFHPSNLVMVRLSHSILYPSVLLLLTRRRLTMFFIWLLFIEIDVFHLLADMFHYVSGPELAEERLLFQGGETDCYVNVQFVQTMLAYPLNFVYLTTSLGDTITSEGIIVEEL